MAQFVIPDVEDEVKRRLQERAARHGRSLEDEVREILRSAVAQHDGNHPPLGSLIAGLFHGRGFDTEIPEFHAEAPRPASFGE